LDVGIKIGFRLFPTLHEKNEIYLMPRGLFSVSQQLNHFENLIQLLHAPTRPKIVCTGDGYELKDGQRRNDMVRIAYTLRVPVTAPA